MILELLVGFVREIDTKYFLVRLLKYFVALLAICLDPAAAAALAFDCEHRRWGVSVPAGKTTAAQQ